MIEVIFSLEVATVLINDVVDFQSDRNNRFFSTFTGGSRVLVEGLLPLAVDWQQMLALLAVASLLVGNLAAIAQTNLKRMLAYSSVAHAGFILVGLLSFDGNGTVSIPGRTGGTANGSFVKITDVVGMVELNDQVFRIANVVGGANTFELEGENSTTYNTFISGTATPVATFQSMTTVQDISASGGEFDFIHATLEVLGGLAPQHHVAHGGGSPNRHAGPFERGPFVGQRGGRW